MSFQKYQHLERLGTSAVEGIEFGDVYVFPKLDGTNASVWIDGHEVCGGSRNRQLSHDQDNAGFYAWLTKQENIRAYLENYPDDRLFGEWLVPHSLKTYRDSAWRDFYVFDVAQSTEDGLEYLHYDFYKDRLAEFDIKIIDPICVINNPSSDQLQRQLPKNTFLIKDGCGAGEGVVFKNYSYKNKYGKVVWAKLVTSEFKERHVKAMGSPSLKGEKQIESSIADKYVTEALCKKVLAKISLESEFTSKQIPRLLHTVYYDVVTEDCWNFVKENRSPVIDFKKLQNHVFARVKHLCPEVFS